jgi:hypothetical protein
LYETQTRFAPNIRVDMPSRKPTDLFGRVTLITVMHTSTEINTGICP